MEEDLPEIIRLQRLAFKEEADFIGDPNIHPMTQTLEDLRHDFAKEIFLKYVECGMILGSVRAFEEEGTSIEWWSILIIGAGVSGRV
ncbi:MAG: hypothetical protein ABR986_10430 [Methanomassiliicoccales archaeon]